MNGDLPPEMGLSDNTPIARGSETKVVKKGEIASFWDWDEKIPKHETASNVLKLTVMKSERDEEGKRRLIELELPEPALGVTKQEIKALGGAGTYVVKLYSRLKKGWVRSKSVKIHETVTSSDTMEGGEMTESQSIEYKTLLDKAENKIFLLEEKRDELQNKNIVLQQEKFVLDNKLSVVTTEKENIKIRHDADMSLLTQQQTTEKSRLELEVTRITDRYEGIIKEKEGKIDLLTNQLADYKESTQEKITDLKEKIHGLEKANDKLQFSNITNMYKMATTKGEGGGTNSELMLGLVTALANVESQKVSSNTELEIKRIDAKRDVTLANAEATLGDGGILDEGEGEKKSPSLLEKLPIGDMLQGLIQPIQGILSKAGYTIISVADHAKQLDEAQKQGAEALASVLQEKETTTKPKKPVSQEKPKPKVEPSKNKEGK